MINQCPKCNFEVEPTDKFCGGCGLRIKSISNFEAKTQVEMKLADIRMNLAMVYYQKGIYKKAIETFQAILEENPDHQQALEMLNTAKQKINEKNATN
jgi:lipopolysaccharide biosynthesis regulator YciM